MKAINTIFHQYFSEKELNEAITNTKAKKLLILNLVFSEFVQNLGSKALKVLGIYTKLRNFKESLPADLDKGHQIPVQNQENQST